MLLVETDFVKQALAGSGNIHDTNIQIVHRGKCCQPEQAEQDGSSMSAISTGSSGTRCAFNCKRCSSWAQAVAYFKRPSSQRGAVGLVAVVVTAAYQTKALLYERRKSSLECLESTPLSTRFTASRLSP